MISRIRSACGFSKIQKYECGTNITAGRLVSLNAALSVSVNYFFDGFGPAGTRLPANDLIDNPNDALSQKETVELCGRIIASLSGRRLLDLAKVLDTEAPKSPNNLKTYISPESLVRYGRMPQRLLGAF